MLIFSILPFKDSFFGQLMFVYKIANDILLYVVFKLGRKMLHDPWQINTNYHGSPNQGIEVLDTIKRKSIDFFFMTARKMLTPQSTLCLNSKTLKNRNHGKIPLVV